MQVTIVSRGSNPELADRLYRAVVSEELRKMQRKHARQIEDLTCAYRMTEARLSKEYEKELIRIAKIIRGNPLQRVADRIVTAWAIFWALLLEFGFIEEIREDEDA